MTAEDGAMTRLTRSPCRLPCCASVSSALLLLGRNCLHLYVFSCTAVWAGDAQQFYFFRTFPFHVLQLRYFKATVSLLCCAPNIVNNICASACCTPDLGYNT